MSDGKGALIGLIADEVLLPDQAVPLPPCYPYGNASLAAVFVEKYATTLVIQCGSSQYLQPYIRLHDVPDDFDHHTSAV
jgi:hypothetical protein